MNAYTTDKAHTGPALARKLTVQALITLATWAGFQAADAASLPYAGSASAVAGMVSGPCQPLPPTVRRKAAPKAPAAAALPGAVPRKARPAAVRRAAPAGQARPAVQVQETRCTPLSLAPVAAILPPMRPVLGQSMAPQLPGGMASIPGLPVARGPIGFTATPQAPAPGQARPPAPAPEDLVDDTRIMGPLRPFGPEGALPDAVAGGFPVPHDSGQPWPSLPVPAHPFAPPAPEFEIASGPLPTSPTSTTSTPNPSEVPEPGSLALMAVGLLALWQRRSRRT